MKVARTAAQCWVFSIVQRKDRLVDYATVYSDGKVVFTFRNGVEVGTEI